MGKKEHIDELILSRLIYIQEKDCEKLECVASIEAFYSNESTT